MNRTLVKTLSYIGAAINEGQPMLGAKKSPQVIRQSGVFEALQKTYGLQKLKDHGDISFESLSLEDQNRKPISHMVNNLHKLDPLLGALNKKIKQVFDQKEDGEVILNIGGDHSIGSATISAALSKNPNLKVIWVDAHADFVDPYAKGTPSQNYHGMPLSHVSGLHSLPGFGWMQEKLPFSSIVLIGIRDLDADEFESLKRHNVKCFTMEHVQKLGIGEVMNQTFEYLDSTGEHPIHLSYDLDGIDPYIVNQTGTVARDGLSHREACHIVKRIVKERNLVSMDIVELNTEVGDSTPRPTFRNEQYLNPRISESVGMVADLITSLMDKQLTL